MPITQTWHMPHSCELYKSVTADRSQVCDGRTAESLVMLKEESQVLQQKMSPDNLRFSSYTVSCNDAQGEIQRQNFVFNDYRPINKATPAAPYQKNRKVSTEGEHADVPSPDDVTAISKVADWFQNNFDLSRQPPKMPYDAQSGLHEACDAKESSPIRLSHCRSSSMPTDAELEMWKTGHNDKLTPPVKEHKRRQHSDDKIESPSKADRFPPPAENTDNALGTPSKVMLRKKSRPQHRSPQVNRSIRSIMKTPKYSESMTFNLDSDVLSTNAVREKGVFHRSKSMPPLGPIGDLLDPPSGEDGWLPKGVEFQSNAMVYIFRK